jgi:hypothetical protein
MQKGLTNITSATITTLVDEDLRTRSINSIAMTNNHATTAVTVELYIQDRTSTVEILSTLVNVPETSDIAGGINGTTGTFDALTNVEVGDEVVFYDPVHTTEIIPQITDPITVASLTSSTVCELSSIVIAPDNAVAKFYQLEKGYIIKTDIPGQTTLVIDNVPNINNKTSTLKLKTTGAGLAIATPLTLNIT